MRVEGKERGKIESGFERVSDGWHIMKFEEGIDYLKNKDGEMVKTKNGDPMWKIPMVVDDEGDADNGIGHDHIAIETVRGEEMIANMLAATGLWKKFADNFPGDVSLFEEKVMSKVKTQLPGKLWRVHTKEGKAKEGQEHGFVNIDGYGKMSDKIADLDEAFGFNKKKGGGKGTEKAADTKNPEPEGENKGGDDNWD